MSDLVEIMQALYRSEINCGVQSFWDGGFTVRLGDDLNGTTASENFEAGELGEAGEWLHEQALKHYPSSDYALRSRVAA